MKYSLSRKLYTSIQGLFVILLASCSAPKASVSYERIVLQESPLALADFDQTILDEMHTYIHTQPEYRNALSMLVVRDGTMVSEAYFNGATPESRQSVKSVTKSVLSLLVGIAQDQNCIRSTEQTMGDLFPAYLQAAQDSAKRAINLHHALTMQTGLKWYENMEWFFNISWDPNWMFRSKNTVQYVLGLDMEDVPGGHFHYSTGTSQLVAGAIRQTTGKTPFEFASEHLFRPMGMDKVAWAAGKDGLNYGGVGLELTPREMAMIGQLCLQKGTWNGRQLVSEEWISQSTKGYTRFEREDGPYGYHWWIRPFGYSAQGYGGQYIYVLPEWNIVVVFTARNNKPQHISHQSVEHLITNYVMKAFTSNSSRLRPDQSSKK